MAGRYIGWIVITTGILTFLPLVLEVNTIVFVTSEVSPNIYRSREKRH